MICAEKELWGLIEKEPVYLFRLRDEEGMEIDVSNYGCIIQGWRVRTPAGSGLDLVLGYDSLEEYRSSETYFGAAIGPVADRLANGRCIVGNEKIQFPINSGVDCVHSGKNGYHSRIWDWHILDEGIEFAYTYPTDENPLPGCLHVVIRYLLLPENTLRIEYEAKSNCDTIVSMTNHSYFTLNSGCTDCKEDILKLNANHYAETCRDTDPICSGRSMSVEGTPLDFKAGKCLKDALSETDFSEIQRAGGIDHYFLVDGSGMREHARLHSASSGLILVCRSDAPGILVYTANGLENEKGKNDQVYHRNYGVCMETECFPNAANIADYRNQVLLPAGNTVTTCTEFSIRYIDSWSTDNNTQQYKNK